MSKFAVLCPLEGMEQMAQNQWSKALQKSGHQIKTFNLRSKGIDPRANLPKLVNQICDFNPEAIFVEGLLGFNLPEFYQDSKIQKIPIASFWFDDPYRSLAHLKKEDPFFDLLRLKNIHHFIWDGHWRKWLKEKFQIHSYPIHLAADPDDFSPKPTIKDHADAVVFVGTVISSKKLKAIKDSLVPVTTHLANTFEENYRKISYGSSPYLILEQIIGTLAPKWNKAFQMLQERDSEAIKLLHTYVWMIGKNETRIRILKSALSVAPVLMLSGNLEQSHASETEMKELLGGDFSKLIYRDTTEYETKLSELYRFGKLHIQATDPQSIEGGIPFRVFQTTACGKPLLTDPKKELGECYQYEKEILTFDSDQDLPEKLTKALSDSKQLDDTAKNGRERFLKEHTWTHRMEFVLKTIQI